VEGYLLQPDNRSCKAKNGVLKKGNKPMIIVKVGPTKVADDFSLCGE